MLTSSFPQDTYSIEDLETLAKKAADSFKSVLINDFDLERYKQFLNTMYHYTSKSGQMIQLAESRAHNEELKAFFAHMLAEEQSHYLLAKQDLKALGQEVSSEVPQTVQEFHANWHALGDTIYPYLGAIYVFENIAKYIQIEGKALYEKLGLTKKQRRWVAVHLEADLEHGEEIKALCSGYFDQDSSSCLKGGKVMCDSWINVFTTH